MFMKRMKKVLKIAISTLLGIGVIVAMVSFKSPDELTAEEKKQIQIFNMTANANSTTETSATTPTEDVVTQEVLDEEKKDGNGDGNTGETKKNENRIEVTPIPELNKNVEKTKPINKPHVVKQAPKTQSKPEPKPEKKSEPKPELKPEPQPEPEPVDPPAADNGDGDSGLDPYEEIR